MLKFLTLHFGPITKAQKRAIISAVLDANPRWSCNYVRDIFGLKASKWYEEEMQEYFARYYPNHGVGHLIPFRKLAISLGYKDEETIEAQAKMLRHRFLNVTYNEYL